MSRVKLQTLLDRSNRNMASGTHKVVRESALEIVKRAYKEGINAQISEGHRSNARQNELYAQGRTKPGKIVTNAKAGQSWHNFGIAIDYFLTTKDGNKALWTVNKDWRRVAEIGKELGFEWGGDWTSFKDYPHLQMTGGYTLAQLRAGKKPHLVSKVKKNKTGWIKNSTGWWFKNKDGSYPKNQWKKISNVWYLFDNKGYMLKGWQKVKGTWYRMDKSGAMITGWTKSNGRWFYLNKSGAMLTGLQVIGKNAFYLDPADGAMLENSKKRIPVTANKHGHLK